MLIFLQKQKETFIKEVLIIYHLIFRHKYFQYIYFDKEIKINFFSVIHIKGEL